jgi:UDP-N-acetylglucosamine 4,6-dehydratase
MKKMFHKKRILVTGGTGSFGKRFIKNILENHPEIEKIIIFSRDELKQYQMSFEEPYCSYPDKVRFFIGDVRDLSRLKMAFEEVDIVIHAAALKQVPIAEYNPFEAIKTNIIGAQNIIEASLTSKIERVVALSSDKAVSPINLYGATKLCSDKLFLSANNIKGKKKIGFSVVRYGNVMGSRGSVIPFFLEKAKEGFLPITDKRMTRFNITLDQGVDLVKFALADSQGGEIYVPKIPSYKIMDVAEAIAPSCKKKIIGIRPGEKIHEEMVSVADSLYTYEFNKHYIIIANPQKFTESGIDIKKIKAKKVKEGFNYASNLNDEWLTVNELRKLIKANVDPNFSPF